VTALKLTRLH